MTPPQCVDRQVNCCLTVYVSVGRLALKPPGIRRMPLPERAIIRCAGTPNGVVMLTHHRRLEGKPPYSNWYTKR